MNKKRELHNAISSAIGSHLAFRLLVDKLKKKFEEDPGFKDIILRNETEKFPALTLEAYYDRLNGVVNDLAEHLVTIRDLAHDNDFAE